MSGPQEARNHCLSGLPNSVTLVESVDENAWIAGLTPKPAEFHGDGRGVMPALALEQVRDLHKNLPPVIDEVVRGAQQVSIYISSQRVGQILQVAVVA